MNYSDELVEIDYDDTVTSTSSSYLLEIDDKNVWIPKSLIAEHDENKKRIEIPEWLAYEKELI